MFFVFTLFLFSLNSFLNGWWQQQTEHKIAAPLVSTHIIINNSNSYEQTEKIIKEVMQESRAQVLSFYQLIFLYKYRTIMSLLAASYGTLSYQFFSLKYRLQKQTCWSLWHSDKTFEDILSVSQKKTGKELLAAIQQRYIIEDNPADFIQPLMLFMKAVEQEKIDLEKYLRLKNISEKLYVGHFFLYDTDLISKVPDRLARLAYYKASFISWLGEYKYDKSSQKSFSEPLLLKDRQPKQLSEQEKNAEVWKFIRDTG